jgi:hypothetical protein
MPIRKYGNEVFRMKYALLFFSFLFVFILNVDSAMAQKTVSSLDQCRSLGGNAITDRQGIVVKCDLKNANIENARGEQINSVLSKEGACKARLNGTNGCWSLSSGTCKTGKNLCTSESLCKANTPKDGNYWYGGSCNESPERKSVETAKSKCECDKAEIDYEADENFQCSLVVNGERKAFSKTAQCPSASKESAESTAKDNNCSSKKANYGWDGNECICGAGQEVDASHYEEVSSGDCRKKGAVAATSKSGEVPSCLQDFKAKAEACKTDGFKAVNSCNKDNKEANAQWSAAQSVIGPMAQIMQMRGQQQGSAETCFQAGALATTTLGAMDLLKETCDNEIEACHNKCEEAEEAYKKVDELCKEEVKNILPPLNKDEIFANMKKEADKLNAELEQGTQACEKDAKTNQARVIDMMNGMNRSAQQAAKCQCQLTAGQTNCDQILGPADCKLTPKDPRCPQAVTIKCAGTDYNTKECLCLRDPKAVSCIGTTGSGVSQVAGFNPVGAGSTSFKTSGAGSGGGLGDFPSDAAVAVSSDKTQGGVDSPFSAAANGGGGGPSGGGGGSDGGGEGGAAEPEAKTGIAGLFNNLKTGVAGLFGGGSKKPTTTDRKNFGGKNGASKNVDPNQWRPVGLRGIAGGNGIGSKNSDIFKTVNNQYNNQYHTLMTLPAEGPK